MCSIVGVPPQLQTAQLDFLSIIWCVAIAGPQRILANIYIFYFPRKEQD